ncbi:MAG: phosphoribosyltransferase [Acidimicrobiia bacterium]
MERYRDREHAGYRLAASIADVAGLLPVDLVLGIPRGGVIVAAPVAEATRATLDVAVARKLGAPMQRELAMGAVAPGGPPVLNTSLISRLRVTGAEVEAELVRQRAEAHRRETLYRAGRPPLEIAGRRVVVVDDGVATGATLVAVIRKVKAAGAASIIAAVPVGPSQTLRDLVGDADEVVCPLTPAGFRAVGEWYDDFAQVEDDEVVAALVAPHGGA